MVNILCYDSRMTAVSLGGGARGCVRGGLRKVICVPVFFVFCCSSYVNRSIELCMYVDDTKFDLTP
jgi:hypothetical protein